MCLGMIGEGELSQNERSFRGCVDKDKNKEVGVSKK